MPVSSAVRDESKISITSLAQCASCLVRYDDDRMIESSGHSITYRFLLPTGTRVHYTVYCV